MSAMAQTSLPGFDDLASLRARHLEMLGRQPMAEGDPDEVSADAVREFLQRARATGAILSDREDREAAQRVIDYWNADLVAAGRSDAALGDKVTLDPCALETDAVAMPGPVPTQGAPYSKPRALEYIRLASVARQWRDTGSDAYLLSGDALEKAPLHDRDPDIARLIVASLAAEQKVKARQSQVKNRFIALMLAVCGLLAFLSYVAFQGRSRAETALTVARSERARAEAASKAADDARAFAVTQWTIANEARDRAFEDKAEADALAREKADLAASLQLTIDEVTRLSESREEQRAAAQARLAELESRQRLLDQAIAALGDALVQGEAQPGDIPDAVRQEVLANLAARVRGGALRSGDLPADLAEAVRGLQPDIPWPGSADAFPGFAEGFLQTGAPERLLPQVPARLRAQAWDQGAPVPYLNYSLVLDARRRFAILAAANLDRTQRNVLPGGSAPLTLDPRLPPTVQPDPGWYRGDGLKVAELVGRNDIAWGMAGADAGLVDRMVAVYPNTAPVAAALIPGWTSVSDWVQSGHNPSASRVTILSGFILAPEGPGERLPVALWKLAVSLREAPQMQAQQQMQQQLPNAYPDQKRLVAEAFVIDAAAAVDDYGLADPARFQVSIGRLEQMTGLIFAPEIHAADTAAGFAMASEDAALAAEVPDLDGPLPEDRRALAQRLVTALRDPSGDPGGQRLIVEALLRVLQNDAALTDTGLLNTLFVLSEVPEPSWDRADWLDLKAGARRGVADMEARQQAEKRDLGPRSQGFLDQLKRRLDLGGGDSRRVTLQFSGLTRERAQDLRSALTGLGWRLEREERTKGATGDRRVLYSAQSSADAAAARLLSADITVLGWEGIDAAPDARLPPGSLDIQVDNQGTRLP